MDITNTAVGIFVKNDSLISTSIEEINLIKDEFGELQIELLIKNFAKKSKFSKIKLLFKSIIEFNFYYSSNYSFYNIENYKLLNIGNEIYFSLDPDESILEKSVNDSDYIHAKTLILKEM